MKLCATLLFWPMRRRWSWPGEIPRGHASFAGIGALREKGMTLGTP